MRHKKTGKRLGRTWEHRKALFRNMAKSLLTHGRIQTTETKAKELRRVADKLVTMALQNDLHARRQAYKILNDHGLVKKLFDEIGPRFSGVQGGFTRVVKLSAPRRGDNAPMAIIEFSLAAGEQPKGPKAKAAAPVAEAPAEAPAEETAEAPAEETAEAPAEESAEAPAEETAEAPAEEAAETPAEEVAEAPEEAPEASEDAEKKDQA